MPQSSLRRQLVLPYVLLVVSVSAAIAWIAYQAGDRAVTALSHQVLTGIVTRIGGATEQHLAGAATALRALYPGLGDPHAAQAFPADPATLERRLWMASRLSAGVGRQVYFSDVDGELTGIRRDHKDVAQRYLHDSTSSKRQAPHAGPARKQVLLGSADWLDRNAMRQEPAWSPIHDDEASRESTITLARPVYRSDGRPAGVAGIDVRLADLTDFLRTQAVSENGVAFIIDRDGYMVATSGKESLFDTADGGLRRLHARAMPSPLIREAYARVSERDEVADAAPFATSVGALEIAATELGARQGLDWTVVAVAPRSDFMAEATSHALQGAFIAMLCVAAALVIGVSLLNRVLLDIRRLTEAAKQIGRGEPLSSLNIRRQDEIGQLALSFSEMEHNLRIDKLTAVFNRASLIAQIGFLRRQLEQKSGERPNFALLFIDLDHFKKVNDHHGHDAGDRVLITVATRLKESVRVSDVVARYGGDEFVVLLKGVTAAGDVAAMEEKIRRIIEEPIRLDHGSAQVGVSIGWALFPNDGEDIDALLKIADKRMFETKRSRRAAR